MRVALHTVIASSKKEPLAEMAERVRKAFLDAGLGEPHIRFTFMNPRGKKGTAVIDRVVKRYAEMERFITEKKIPISPTGIPVLSNVLSEEQADYATLLAILAGVPRSYPFPSVALHFTAPVFGERLIGLPAFGHSYPGVLITDSSWVSGRQRALAAYTTLEVSEDDKKLPPNPAAVDAVIKACGKAKKPVQVPIRAPEGGIVGSISPERIEAVKKVNTDFRARLGELVEAAKMPHALPPAAEIRTENRGVLAGPRKPALEATFKPMGYDCKGGSGVFYLTRRTAGNLTCELYLDVGTWSHSVTGNFTVIGAGFRATLGVRVAPGELGQYPIGDAAQWQKIVENIAAMVRELDRVFVPAIEEAAGPSPAWYQA